jgi:hypothetical protein
VWAAVGGAVLVLACGIPLAAILNIWIDEAFTLHTTGDGLGLAWSQARSFEVQPPLYFCIVAGWRLIDESSILFARFPSICFAAAAVAVLVIAAHRFVPRVPPTVVAVAFALNPLVLWAATEMRVYALVLLIGAVLIWSFCQGFLAAAAPRWARPTYTTAAILGLYTQYYIAFFLVATGITLLALRRTALKPFALCAAIVALAFAPFVPTVLAQLHDSGGFVLPSTFAHGAHELANAFYQTVLPHVLLSGPAKYAGFGLTAILAVAIFAVGRPAFPRDVIASGITIAWLATLVVFSIVFGVTGLPSPVLSHTIVVAPASLLVMLLLIDSITRRRALVGSITAGVYALFTVSMLATVYHPPLAKTGDWRRVAAVIAAGDPATPVAVFPAEFALVLGWYLPRPTVPIPAPIAFTSQYVRDSTLTSVDRVAHALDPVRDRSQRLWVVTANCRGPKLKVYDYHCEYLGAYLAEHYRVVKSADFNGSNVRLYERAPERVGAAALRARHPGTPMDE